jgi:NitT/TauT family transport system permease protein
MTARAKTLAFRVIQLVPFILFLVLWEAFVRVSEGASFFFGRPSRILFYLTTGIADGSLLKDFAVTLLETVLGFGLGSVLGAALGLGLWYSRIAFALFRPYIIALGSAPVFAFAPLIIVWFGTGLVSKVATAAISTIFVALLQAYMGASEVSSDYLLLMRSFHATKGQTFRKVIVPAAAVWVISAFKLNVGFAILGAFIGEFISSSAGLGHLILVAGGLFDISRVLTGIALLVIMALGLNGLVSLLEDPLRRLVARL